MLVKELKKILNEFDDDLPVVVKNESLQCEIPIETVKWQFDGLCKIIIDGE